MYWTKGGELIIVIHMCSLHRQTDGFLLCAYVYISKQFSNDNGLFMCERHSMFGFGFAWLDGHAGLFKIPLFIWKRAHQ